MRADQFSIAFPAWCLGHDRSAQIRCVSYAQDLADKLARDCRSIMTSQWYRQIFRTRLAAHRQPVQEFITTARGYRLATSNGGVLTGRGANIILIDALPPDREPVETLERIRRTIGEYNFAGQYQQTPAPLGGGLVKVEWFKRYGANHGPRERRISALTNGC
jgi:hypothetical protein